MTSRRWSPKHLAWPTVPSQPSSRLPSWRSDGSISGRNRWAYGYLEWCSDLKLKHASFWVAWQMLLQNTQGSHFWRWWMILTPVVMQWMYVYIYIIYIYLILYRNSFLNKTRCINGWGQGISMLHITFTRQQAKCCGGEVLVTSPDASYGLATLTRLAPSTHPKSSRNEALFPFTIMIISPFVYLQGCFNSSHDEPVFLQKVGRFPILDTREMMFQRPSEEDQDRSPWAWHRFFIQSFGRSFSCTFCTYRDANEQINRYKNPNSYLRIFMCTLTYIYIYICTYVYVHINMKQTFFNVDFSHINICINSW